MKLIKYRGGVVEFHIPTSWKEEYSDMDGGTFYEDKADSGTFRLQIITVKSPTDIVSDSAVKILNSLKTIRNKAEAQSNGNAIARYDDTTVDRGTKIKIYYWSVCNPLPPNHARIATFSYTILQSQENNPQTMEQIEMLDREVRSAQFSKEMGVNSK